MSAEETTKKTRKRKNKSAAEAAPTVSLSAVIVPPVPSDDNAGSLVHHIAIPAGPSSDVVLQRKDNIEVPDEGFDLESYGNCVYEAVIEDASTALKFSGCSTSIITTVIFIFI